MARAYAPGILTSRQRGPSKMRAAGRTAHASCPTAHARDARRADQPRQVTAGVTVAPGGHAGSLPLRKPQGLPAVFAQQWLAPGYPQPEIAPELCRQLYPTVQRHSFVRPSLVLAQ
jgi:hypothetical protein